MSKSIQILITAAVILLFQSCTKLDFFLFENEEVSSIDVDYHGLPLYSGNNSPSWVTTAVVEDEVYLNPANGAVIKPEDIGNYSEYIHGAFIPRPEGCEDCPLKDENITFLYHHGNSGTLFRYWYRAVALWSMGANVFIYNYRGYGLSRGETERGKILQDANATASYVKARNDVDNSRIIVYGYSMGGIPASYIAGRSHHKNSFLALILESALDSPEKILHLSTGFELGGALFFDDTEFDGPAFIGGTTLPVLQIHGANDRRVVPRQAENYYNVLSGRENYTSYIGKTNGEYETWAAKGAHRNLPIVSFSAEDQVADYWDDPANPNNCCVHPAEYGEPQFQSFLAAIGSTTGEQMLIDADIYEELISSWILDIVSELVP